MGPAAGAARIAGWCIFACMLRRGKATLVVAFVGLELFWGCRTSSSGYDSGKTTSQAQVPVEKPRQLDSIALVALGDSLTTARQQVLLQRLLQASEKEAGVGLSVIATTRPKRSPSTRGGTSPSSALPSATETPRTSSKTAWTEQPSPTFRRQGLKHPSSGRLTLPGTTTGPFTSSCPPVSSVTAPKRS